MTPVSILIGMVILVLVFWKYSGGILNMLSPVSSVPTSSSNSQVPGLNLPIMQTISLTTSDNVKIAADFYPATAPANAKGAILVHMMPATKESWHQFAVNLEIQDDYDVIAIDLRGHGASDEGPNGYQSFSDAEHQKSILDLEAAFDFLKSKGLKPENISVVGASIGANLSVEFLANHPDVPRAVLLSPGIDYRGVKAGDYLSKLSPAQKIFFAASNDDTQSNGQVIKQLEGSVPAGVAVQDQIYQHAGHGTNMFSKEDPDLQTELINWLK